MYNVFALWAVPARPEGIAPMMSKAAITTRGPYRSTRGPVTSRTSNVADSATMLELATSLSVSFKSDLIASGISGGNANQDRNATKNPTGSTCQYGERWRHRVGGSTYANLDGMIDSTDPGG
jgi:hypothetical protein